jgi:type 1 glutamine amidotransferase
MLALKMSSRAFLAFAALALAVACGSDSDAPASTPTSPSSPGTARVLVVTHTVGFRHGSIPVAESTIESLGRSSGLFTVTFCRDAADVARLLSATGLAGFDAVVFANTTGNLGIPDLAAFLTWIADGHGFAGMHSASDTYHDAPSYLDMLGNEFQTHGAETEVDAVVENSGHPASAPLGSGFRVFDEIYRFTRNNRGEVTTLLSLDRYPTDGLPNAGQPGDLPLAWARTHGRGRVFYTALGHREDVWQNPLYQQHVLGGIRWVLGP